MSSLLPMHMGRAACGASLFVGLALASIAVAQQPAAPPASSPVGGPRLVVEKSVWDFGTVWSGDPCSTTIRLTNGGDALLKIEKVDSSCGCTVPKPAKTELQPGESTELHISYNTHKAVVDVRQTVTLRSNDPARPRTEIMVRGVVKIVYDCKPLNRLTFGQVLLDTLETRTIEMTNNLSEPVKLSLPPAAQQPAFDIKLDEVDPGHKYRLSATTKPPLKPGTNYIMLRVQTDNAKFPTLDIAISAYAVERVGVSPPMIILTPKTETPTTRLVRVNYLPDHPLKITKISTSHPDLIKAEPTLSHPSKRGERFAYHLVKIDITTLKGLPENGATVTIETDDPEPKFRKLEVTFEIYRPKEGDPDVDPADFE